MGLDVRVRHVLYLGRRMAQDPDNNQQAVFIYDTVRESKRALDIILEDDELIWDGDQKLLSSSGIVIEVRPCKDTKYSLAMLWAHEDSVVQMGKLFSPNLAKEARAYRYGRQPDTLEPKEEKVRTRAPGAMSRAPRDGMIPVGDIAAALGISAREARGALRGAKVPKPASGWAWKPDEVEGIKAKIKEAL